MLDIPAKKKGSWIGKIGNRIMAGFLLILPITLTLYIAIFLSKILTDWSDRIIQYKAFEKLREIFGFEVAVRLFSLFLVLIVLFSIGTVAKYTIGKRILTIVERWILKVPVVSIVYSTIQQIIDAVKNPTAGMFRKVVLFEYPRKGLYVIGFLTNENTEEWELGKQTGKDLVSVFLPTTPNPTSGFLLFVPREDCTYLKMGVTEGMRLVISGGALAPRDQINLPPSESEIQEEGVEPFLTTEQVEENETLENEEKGTSNIEHPTQLY